MQPSLVEVLCTARKRSTPTQFVDLFCGGGGASAGATSAGYNVVLAVDCCQTALKVHKDNHPDTVHICTTLPPVDPLPTPGAGEDWHLHGSPPCTNLSVANQKRDAHDREDGLQMIRWYLDFALSSSATSWSMEQVATPVVLSLLQEYKKAGSRHRNRIAFSVFLFYDRGVPQNRRRLIAGSPDVVARLLRVCKWHQSVQDVIRFPRGTHTRSFLRYSNGKRDLEGKVKWIYKKYTDDDCCFPITGPSHCTVCSYFLRWTTPHSGQKPKSLSVKETAALQCFPEDYVFNVSRSKARKCIANAVPPVIMYQLLTGRKPPQKSR